MFLILSCSTGINNNNTKNSSKIQKAAQNNKEKYLSKIPSGSEKDYGFENYEELSKATVGEPIEIIALPSETKSGEVFGVFIKTNSARVPLLVDGKFKALLNAEEIGNNINITDFGAATLAREIEPVFSSIRANYSEEIPIYMLRVYSIKSDFLVVYADKSKEYIEIYPLPNFRKTYNIKYQKISYQELLILIENRK